MSSSRLPGKVMMPIIGKPLIQHVVERTSKAQLIDDVVVATSDDRTDDQLCRFLSSKNIKFFRGSLDDVLERYFYAALAVEASHIVRITADCPLVEGLLIDEVIRAFEQGTDYCSNCFPERTFPLGLSVEMMTIQSLKDAQESACSTFDREHVTPYIYKNPSFFTIRSVVATQHQLKHPEWRLCIDEIEDLELVRSLFEHLSSQHGVVSILDLEELFGMTPDLFIMNSHVVQKS